ncbi:MAG: hypothetical protein WA003_02160 [Desulfuromonadaceae bacterium]
MSSAARSGALFAFVAYAAGFRVGALAKINIQPGIELYEEEHCQTIPERTGHT